MQFDFIKEDEVSDIFETYLTDEFQNKHVIRETESFETSHLTECPRRLNYASDGEKGKHTQTQLEAKIHEFAKKKLIAMFAKNKQIKIVGEAVEVSDCNYNMVGVLDVAVKYKDNLYLVQFYSLKDEEFKHILEEGPPRKHVVEVVLNRWLTEKGELVIIYENRYSGEHKVYHIQLYKPIVDAAKAKSLQLINDKLLGKTPDRPYKTSTAAECTVCEYCDLCWHKRRKDA